MNKYLFSAIIIALLASFGQIFLKKAVLAFPIASFNSFFNLILSLDFMIAVLIYAVCSVSWVVILSNVRVSVAYPILSLTFIFVPILAVFTLGETLRLFNILGIVLVTVGVACIFLSAD